MQLSLNKIDLQSYLSSQLNNFFPDKNFINFADYCKSIDKALQRLDFCFKHVSHHRYNNNGTTLFNHLYSDHYLVFIWFLSNTIWVETGNQTIATKLYYLNKVLHSFDCMYDTRLPDIFLIFHGAGTMLGKATYADYFVALHGCTIGSHKGGYPVMGKGVSLTAHSAIIGNCEIGNRVSISVHTSVFEKDIPDDTVVYIDSDTGKLHYKSSKSPYSQQFFNVDLNTL